MPIWIHLPAIQYGNTIGFQMIIQRAFQLYGIPGLTHVAMGDLSQPMHAGVGAASSGNAWQIGLQLCQGLFQRSLHGGQAILPLPAVEPLAIVFNF